MPTSAGLRNRRITIKRRAAGVDAIGQPSTDYNVTVAELWAQIDPLGAPSVAAERVEGGREVGPAGHVFRIGYRTDIRLDDRIEHAGAVYTIKQVRPDLRTRLHTDIAALAGAVP